jgi:hypothetical protein
MDPGDMDCERPGCGGSPEPAYGLSKAPTFWVRERPTGELWCSAIAPLAPAEWPGSETWQCPSCHATFRAVEGGRYGHAVTGRGYSNYIRT